MRSKISTFASTAMPMVNTTPAMPGNVNVVPTEHMTPSRMMMLVMSATSATITAYTAGAGGDSIVFTFGTNGATASVASTPAVAVQADPSQDFLIASSVLNNFTSPSSIAVGSTAVPFKLIGAGNLAGATVTLSAGTATVTQVTPNAIFGTITIPSTVTGPFPLLVTATVTNTTSWRSETFTIDDTVVNSGSTTTSTAAAGSSPQNASFGTQIGLNQLLATDDAYAGKGYTVAVIDTGIDYNNPDLGGGWGKRRK